MSGTMKYIDVSTYQGVIDWAKVKAAGIDGAMIRAGFGKNNIDDKFERNITECNRLGIPCGVYWFSYAYTEDMAKREAEYCLAAVEGHKLELPICFDFEYDSVRYAGTQGVSVNKKLATDLVHAFCKTVEAAGYYVVNYANLDYLRNYFDDTVKRYDLWHAWYASADNPTVDCDIWQYSSKGKVDGINANVDMNISYKDYAAIIVAAGMNRLQPAERPAPNPIFGDQELFNQLMADWMAEQGKREPDSWSAEARAWAESNGIIKGTGAGMEYKLPITREEVVTLLFRFFNSKR